MSGSSMDAATASPQLVAPLGATASPRSALTLADRRQLLANWTGPNAAQLKSLLDAGNARGFDSALLNYMRTRTNVTYFYDLDDRDDYVAYLKGPYNANAVKDGESRLAEVFEHADAIVEHLFPRTATSTSYTRQLPDDIDWLTFTAADRQFIHGLNRFNFWDDLATAHQLSLGETGYQNEYINELKWQLNDWAKQHKPLANANTWDDKGVEPRWWLLDASLRAQTWTEAYFKILGTSGWDAQSNTLFLHRMYLHGDFLFKVEPLPLDQNQAVTHGAGLLFVAQLFPEFKQSPNGDRKWDSKGRNLVANAFGKQFYKDGGHIEESVTYQGSVLHTLLERYRLDQLNGITWGSKMTAKLRRGVESFYQLLNPTGDSPALADSYRRSQIGFFTEARIVLDNAKYPVSRPRLNNVWFLGPDALDNVNALTAPTPPVLTTRGDSYAMTQSGYYVLRSTQNDSDPTNSARNSRQVIFDVGPTGGRSHGQFDLLNFEYAGYGRVLIADPGPLRYDDSADRAYVISTPAHNTISIDGKNHAQLEGPRNQGFKLDGFDRSSPDYLQVTGHHFGYKALQGAPALGRSIWFDKNSTMVVADWGKSSSNHNYAVSFNLPTTKVSSIANNKIRTQFTTNGDDKSKVNVIGNVQITHIPIGTSQTLKREQKFTSSQPPPDEKDPAIRFSVNQRGKNVVFVTLVQAFNGTSLSPSDEITLEFTENPRFGRPLRMRLLKNGVLYRNITIQPPTLTPPEPASATAVPLATSTFSLTRIGTDTTSVFDAESDPLA